MKHVSIFALSLFCVAFFISLFTGLQFADYDVFARLAVGRFLAEHGHIPHHDVFSFNATKDIWYDHEWLFSVIAYFFLEQLGPLGLSVFAIGAALLTTYILFAAQQHQYRAPLLGCVLLCIAAVVSVGTWAAVVRAHVLSFLFFAIELHVLTKYRSRNHWLLVVFFPILFLLWSNAHGGVVVGYGLLGCALFVAYWEKWPSRNMLALAGIFSIIAPLANPYGPEYLEFLYSAVGKHRPLVDEWRALPLNPIAIVSQGYGAFLFFVVLLSVSLLRRRRSIPLEGQLFTVCSMWYGAQHVRLLPFFYFAVAVFCIQALSELLENGLGRYYRLGAQSLALLSIPAGIFSVYWLLLSLTPVSKLVPRTDGYPVQAVEWTRCAYENGRILSSFNAGSFVLWRGYPAFLVGVDGRYEEVYEDEAVLLARRALQDDTPSGNQALARLNPDIVLLCGYERRRTLPAHWSEQYADKHCAVFAKREPDRSVACKAESIWSLRSSIAKPLQ